MKISHPPLYLLLFSPLPPYEFATLDEWLNELLVAPSILSLSLFLNSVPQLQDIELVNRKFPPRCKLFLP